MGAILLEIQAGLVTGWGGWCGQGGFGSWGGLLVAQGTGLIGGVGGGKTAGWTGGTGLWGEDCWMDRGVRVIRGSTRRERTEWA